MHGCPHQVEEGVGGRERILEFTVTNGAACNGTYKWKQAHDPNNSHAADFWWKTRSLRAAGPELLASLPTD